MSSTEFALDDLSNNVLVTDWDVLIVGDEWPALAPVYRMPERDTVSGPKAMLKEGDRITFSRIVVRVGYEFGVHSVTRKEWFEAGARMVAEQTGQTVEAVKKVITALCIRSPFKGMKQAIYHAIVAPLIQQTSLENRNVRAMWFHDYDKPRTGRIVGHLTRMTGKREDGCSSGGGWGEPPEWEPPYLSWAHYQRLYKVRDNNQEMFSMGQDVLVYPADAQWSSER